MKDFYYKTAQEFFKNNRSQRKLSKDILSDYSKEFINRANLAERDDGSWSLSFETHIEVMHIWLGLRKNELTLEELITYLYLFNIGD